MKEIDLIKLAFDVLKNSYSPYSDFRVGAALLTDRGNCYTGVNIENASYGATNCAERTAVFKAVCEGERKIRMIAIASDGEEYIYPCGICRQVLAEFGDEEMSIICTKKNGNYRTHKLGELLPDAFKKMEE